MNKDLIKRLLKDLWEFRNIIEIPFDRGFIGELLIYEQLLRTHRVEDIKYFGSANKGYDFELRLNKRTIQIEVKSTSVKDENGKPKWVRQRAEKFCDIKFDEQSARQYVSLGRDYKPHLFYVFVDVGTWLKKRRAALFVLSYQAIKVASYKTYKQH